MSANVNIIKPPFLIGDRFVFAPFYYIQSISPPTNVAFLLDGHSFY
ncbi:hypothetical protein B23_2270 [Geobacillus thermoleovorans B23]|nr:hypothetical protein B23_2270 [Geobacillus thermoleovorans B23]